MTGIRDLGLSWAQAGLVVLSAIGIYLSFVVLVRLVGQRSLTGRTSFDTAAIVALGAVAGRAVLGFAPTLLGGIVGLSSLFALEAIFGLLRRSPRIDHAIYSSPMLLMADGRVLEENLRKARLVEDELRAQLRQAGVLRYADVAYVILERTGALSVLRVGEAIDREVLTDVPGIE